MQEFILEEDSGNKIEFEGVQESLNIVDQFYKSEFDLTPIKGHTLDYEVEIHKYMSAPCKSARTF